jgi:ethanolamine utilization protein EutA
MSERVTLVGLDFGTTTSSAVVATAVLQRNAVTGRTELSDVREQFRSPIIFTPLDGDRIDLPRTEALLDSWLADARDVFGGGTLLTGLTAQHENAASLVTLIRRRLGDALVVTADDPRLESWLAFHGNCGALSRAHPERPILNLDIGGGTTNLALGQNGEVRRTGCLFIGARHVQVEPGTYRITRISRYAAAGFAQLGIHKDTGDQLTIPERTRLIDYWVGLLEAAAVGDRTRLRDTPIEQVPFCVPPDVVEPVITLSGGVGELVYAHMQGAPWPATTQFGDLGIDIARRLLQSERLGRDLRTFIPAGGGRATVYGLLRHNTEISGATLFLPRPELLPLPELPVLGRVTPTIPDADLTDLLDRVLHSPRGGCLFVSLASADAAAVRTLGGRIALALRQSAFPPRHPLVLLLRENLGKVLGHYGSDWGRLAVDLAVIDEVAVRDAHFVQIGRQRDQVVPVSYHGLHASRDPPGRESDTLQTESAN